MLVIILQEEDSGSSTVSINMSRAPVAGHISSLRAAEQEQKKVSLKDASKKHIDPFTGKILVFKSLSLSDVLET